MAANDHRYLPRPAASGHVVPIQAARLASPDIIRATALWIRLILKQVTGGRRSPSGCGRGRLMPRVAPRGSMRLELGPRNGPPWAVRTVRFNSLSWSPVTESNRRPSPYHGFRSTSWPGISPEGQIRGSASARLGQVQGGSRRMQPPKFLPTGHGGGAHARPRFRPPDLCSIRTAAERKALAEAVRGGFSADGYPLGGDDHHRSGCPARDHDGLAVSERRRLPWSPSRLPTESTW